MTCVKSTENTASQQHQVMSMQNRTVNLYFLNDHIIIYIIYDYIYYILYIIYNIYIITYIIKLVPYS